MELAQAVAELPWLTDSLTRYKRGVLSSLVTLAEHHAALARIATKLPLDKLAWVATASERGDVASLASLAGLYPELAEAVLAVPWGVGNASAYTDDGPAASLAALAARDPRLALEVAALPWLADEVSEAEARAVTTLAALAVRDLALARTVVGLPWLADEISEAEAAALSTLGELSARNLALAQRVAGLSSLADDVSSDEADAIELVSSLALSDPELAQAVVDLAVGGHLVFARTMAELPWVADGITGDEPLALSEVQAFASHDNMLAQTVAELPWLADGLSVYEQWVTADLAGLAGQDVALARTVAGFPWLADEISVVEDWTVTELDWLTESDVDLARVVVEMPSVSGELSRVGTGVIKSTRRLTELGLLDELAQAPWYADGLNDEDLVLFSTLGSVRDHLRLLYDALVDSYDARARSIFLPLVGEVRLWAFDPIEFREGEDPLRQMEDVARVTEAFMAEPFPATDVIMVTSYDTRFGGGAWHAGQYIFVARWGQVPLWAPTVYHEVGYYYFGGGIGPTWLVEGGATFIEALTRDAVGVESLEERRRHDRRDMERICHADDLRNIQQLNALQSRRTTGSHICNYHMGVHFLIMLTLTLGEETTSSALRELYVQSRTEGRRATEKEIYRTFLKHTPPELEAEFRALYRRLHGSAYDDEGA